MTDIRAADRVSVERLVTIAASLSFKRHAFDRQSVLGKWVRNIDESVRTVGAITGTTLEAWCTRRRGEVVIEIVLERTESAGIPRSREIEATIIVGISGQHRPMRNIGSCRWTVSLEPMADRSVRSPRNDSLRPPSRG